MRWIAVSLVALGVLAASASAASRSAHGLGSHAKTTTISITFTGRGGGRYLDITRWLQDSTRECYARKTADETLSVSWTITWNATMHAHGPVVLARHGGTATVQGSVTGNAVRDFCDEPEEGAQEVGADWPGTSECSGPMEIAVRGSIHALTHGTRTTLFLRGPRYGSPPKPCELDVRNGQLAAVVSLPPQAVARLASGATVTIPVGTHHPTAGMTYEPTRTCSQFPHVYDGIVYLYDCEDTLVWDGTVTLTPAR